ncbi:hypothetical protein CF327_g4619 [Tilletia walkeri]|uniref:Endonuclease/exonuclease/phosphatase domain-containing protein n=1 Tax=Tilletia walkeri TaxID=117179 RepID=A0A8X7NA09_9BASI|nr:hypothetical protein CF327_g4619 [Tilletia walkeri]KAE8269404.1 hypothetical protein A4X09_0g2927 [Tilletia walkeri]
MISQLLSLLSAAGVATVGLAAPLQPRAILYPHDIQGAGFLSPYSGQAVANVRGVVTAKGNGGYYIQTPASAWDTDDRTSEGLFVFTTLPTAIAINDLINIGSATVSEYVSSSNSGKQLKLTELTKAATVTVITKNATSELKAIVIGTDRSPPTEHVAVNNPFALPANTTNVENNATVDLNTGIGFWESLESMLVTFPNPQATDRINEYNETYIIQRGSAPVTSGNARGGITFSINDDGSWDDNPEVVGVEGNALDGSYSASTILLGDRLDSTTGVMGTGFGGLPYLYPLKGLRVYRKAVGGPVATNLTSSGTCTSLLVAEINAENLMPTDTSRIAKVGYNIDNFLNNPDVIIMNEIQDNSGNTNDGTVSASQTLNNVVNSISGATYNWTEIAPQNGVSGGEPGGNIRTAFLWRTDRVRLFGNAPAGNATQATGVTTSSTGQAQLTLNPGLIDPTNTAWKSSRKPLVAQFQLVSDNSVFFVIGTHFTSKGGSSASYGPAQAPINGGVQARINQATAVRDFVGNLLTKQSDAKVLAGGDWNEFTGVQPLNVLTSQSSSGPVAFTEIQEDVREERYSYVFSGMSQELDHLFTTPAMAANSKAEAVHVNTWVSVADAESDHDPVVLQTNIC